MEKQKELKNAKRQTVLRDFNRFIRFLPATTRADFQEWLAKLRIPVVKLTTGHWLKFWHESLNISYRNATVLSGLRKEEIISNWPLNVLDAIKNKATALDNIDKKWQTLSGREMNLLKNQAAWFSVNPTFSNLGYRFQIGFRNTGCQYWRDNSEKIGCLNCGYYYETTCGFVPVSGTNLINQFDNAYAAIQKDIDSGKEPLFDVIEFLSDGSFLNDDEVPPEVRSALFHKINSNTSIQRILIETRPEFVSESKVKDLLNPLTRRQSLEIAIGLESTDDFIQTFCINKGYGLNEVEQVVRTISKINESYDNRCSILLYLLLKPAYLTDLEAIRAVEFAIRDIQALRRKYGVEIIAKIEPVVVPQGTILEVLYFKNGENGKAYFPPSYWTVLETLARLELNGLECKVRIGAREDMDRYFDIPAAYYHNGSQTGMLSRVDFLLYEAIQKYNAHHNFTRLMAELTPSLKDSSLQDWKQEMDLPNPAFIQYLTKFRDEISDERNSKHAFYINKESFDDKLRASLDNVEYGNSFQSMARNYRETRNFKDLEQITGLIKQQLSQDLNIPITRIKINDKDIALLSDDLQMLRMHIKLPAHYNSASDVRSIWIGIPTLRNITLTEPCSEQ